MWTEKLKKIISGSLIFFLLFSITAHVPILQYFSTQTYAEEKEFFNLVSIIVDEQTYGDIRPELQRYSKDIQAKLENTQVVILPTPSNASVLDIASLNETLFFKGYAGVKEGIDFESRLIGTILVGKIPVPIVFDGENSGRSILPYVDFEKKSYIFGHESGKYEKSDEADSELVPEIWHGVISPNTGDAGKDRDAIKAYFAKNHDYYTGEGVFAQETGVIDGTDTPAPEGYEPQVFYYDQFKESEALQYQKYVGYEMYLQNIEDITYKRYSKELAEKVKDQVLWVQNLQIQDLLLQVDPNFDMSAFASGGLDVNSSSDILTRYITDNATKKYLEIFNASALGDMRKYVYNAGRYNKSGSKVNVDMPPFLISVLDQVSAEMIKNVNNSLEKEITQVVSNGLSRKIAIPESYSYWDPSSNTGSLGSACYSEFHNFYYGKIANEIESAAQCSIYRGSTLSGTLIEANRGYNVGLTTADLALCEGDFREGDTGAENVSKGYWGGNTPLNFEAPANGNYTNFFLKNNNLQGGIHPVFDILWAKEIQDSSKNPSPLDCFTDDMFLQTYQKKLVSKGSGENQRTECEMDFQAPVLWKTKAGTWSCRTINQTGATLSDFPTLFQQYYGTSGICTIESYTLGTLDFSKKRPQECTTSWDKPTSVCCPLEKTATFKSIPSYILHTSPTNEEFGAQTQSLFTPSLPIDKNRYIDFIGAKGGIAPNYGYQKIDFPQLFRVVADEGQELTLEHIEEKVKQHLDSVSANMNAVIRTSDPNTLQTQAEKDLYDALKTGNYPDADIDLYALLKNKPLEVYSVANQSKEISYFDTLVFAVYWNNLTTVSSKYKFIFENYLGNQFAGNDYAFALPDAKKSYEFAYMAAPGDAANMYIKLDPEEKAIHPYADVLSQNLTLQSTLLSGNIPEESYEDTFKCGPPDGVPIWQWIPAIICWLKDMLPPKIKIGQGSCGYDTLFLDEDEREELFACDGDVNKNGVNDCIEDELADGSLRLESDAQRYFYNTSWVLTAQIYDAQGDPISFDNTSVVSHELRKVEIPQDPTKSFGPGNIKVVYDASIAALSTDDAHNEAQKYIYFTPVSQRSSQGATRTYFSGKNTDANVYFRASLQMKDTQNTVVIDLKSEAQKVEIRGDQVFLNSYIVAPDNTYTSDNTLRVSGEQNFFIVDGTQVGLTQAVNSLGSLSAAEEKLLWVVQNYSKSGNVLPLSYPVSLKIQQDDAVVFEENNISKTKLSQVYPFMQAQTSGEYEIILRDATGFESKRSFSVLAGKATRIKPTLATSLIETGGNISTHLFTIEDQFGNPANGEIYTVDMDISGKGLVFDTTGNDTARYQVLEGYKAFRLKSTQKDGNNVLKMVLKDSSGNIVDTQVNPLRTIENIRLKIQRITAEPKVGGQKYEYALTFIDEDQNILWDLNSRVYLNIPNIYGHVEKSYVDVVQGKARVAFFTTTLAGEDVPLEIQIEGGNKIYKSYIDILPDLPIKIDLSLSKDKIEASRESKTILEAVLKDRYNNEVFTNNTLVLNSEVHERSRSIITFDAAQKTVVRGKAQFQISASDIPGRAYFKISSSPDLAQNSFDLIGQAPFKKERLTLAGFTKADGTLSETGKLFYKEFSGNVLGNTNSSEYFISKFSSQQALTSSDAYKGLVEARQTTLLDFWKQTNSLEVSGVGQNAGSVETFFFWDKEDIEGSAYNSMYTVLAGAPYGDISQENYIASALLFDRNNSSLAVSSLLSAPFAFHDVLQIAKNGSVSKLQEGDITQDLQFRPDFDAQGRLTLDVYNQALWTYIGRLYYNISQNSDISVRILDPAYTSVLEGSDVFLKNAAGQKVFDAYEVGKFQRRAGTFVEVDESYVGEGIQLFLKNGESTFATLKISGDFKTNITRDAGLLQNKLQTLSDTLILHLASSAYSSRELVSAANQSLLKIYYQDPFADRYALDDFHANDIQGLESSFETSGIGWQESNTMLLSVAAGESVGESSKKFQSFSLINLWDPVVGLKPLVKKFPNGVQEKSFDSTVGQLIEKNVDTIGFQTFDYNKDEAVDVVTIQKDGYLTLYENTPVEGGFVEHGNLVYAADGGAARMVKTGDFTADGYDDIFFVTQTGEPAIFNNVDKDFQRLSLKDTMSLSGSIIQAEAYDMDKDGKDDIVTLDDAGQIHVFYGSGTQKNPTFQKKYIGDGYAISLSDEAISHGGAVYFDGLTQIDEERALDILRNSQDYLDAVGEEILSGGPDAGENMPENTTIDESFVERYLYVSLPYLPTNFSQDNIPGESTPAGTQENANAQDILLDDLASNLSTIGGSSEAESLSGVTDELGNFLDQYGWYVQYSGYGNSGALQNNSALYGNSYVSNNYFLRSQYAHLEGIEVKKTFSETSPPFLQTGDTVYFDISLKNTTNRRKNNVAYVDTLPKYFQFADENITILSDENRVIPRKTGIAEYDIIVDSFYLDPGEEVKVRIQLLARPLSYGHIQVGLYETWEVGDDIYGDIILKKDAKNCGKEADIFRSLAVRSYQKWKTTPTCESEALDVGATHPELSDADDDGIPDYLQELINASDGVGNTDPDFATQNPTQSQVDAYNDALDENANLETIQNYGEQVLEDLWTDTDEDGIPDEDDTMDETDDGSDFMDALDQINQVVDDISEDIDEVIQGLSCGFGGGSCFANPLNWAPLAPGNDITLMGRPMGDGLHVNEGIPIFSALTGRQASCGFSSCCLPSVWPANSAAFVPGPVCGPSSAGGSRGTWSGTNFVRVFATPTLTGGAGIAVCFGGPAITAGNANPMGAHPVVPGGNCIVAAMPLFGCEGGEGDPGSLGYPFPGNGLDVIHANCDGDISSPLATPSSFQDAFVQEYLRYLRTGVQPEGLYEQYMTELTRMSEQSGGNYALPTQPLINIWNSDSSALMSTSVSLDTSALAGGNFEDVVQVQNKRVGAFPNFLMDWVERQLDEVTTKLTNLPKLFVVLPDFGGTFDFSWKDFGTKMKQNAQEEAQEAQAGRDNKEAQLAALRETRAGLDCSGAQKFQCQKLDYQITSISGTQRGNGKETLSGIKEAYDFLGNIPLVNIETETINVNVPSLDNATANRYLIDWKYTLEQWKGELESAKNRWSVWAACNEDTPAEQARCEQENSIKQKAYADTDALIQSLETNIEILEEYKEFPQRLAKLINIKEVWLEQILCNIEAIASLLGEWIGTNGKRFKAWVELIVLIKAILKSWQLLVDVFNDYEAECHECKNERQDLNNFTFSLVSAIIPSPPIIQFPKWPDIILDLHNIRAGMTIYMPDFQMNMRPIVLPTLPQLHLPDMPSAGFSLPALPTLPRFTIPELPELPSLPSVELPDLPPPPKIPALFGAVEGILNIMKLVTKVMCILKNSPFVPEWRAGDQIAFLTERNGYLPMDFMDIQPPAFSYSAISAIKITTYVNFEFETEFIIEAIRAITAPLDKATNNIVNMFQMQISDISLVDQVPNNINLDIDEQGETTTEISLAPLDTNPEWIYLIAGILAGKTQKLITYMMVHNDDRLDNRAFQSYVLGQLASTSVTSDPRTAELQALWQEVGKMKYSQEDAFIQELQENNTQKFETLKDIISTEIEYSKQQQQDLKQMSTPSFLTQVAAPDSALERVKGYNTMMEPYNGKTLDAAVQLMQGESETSKKQREDFALEGQKLQQDISQSLSPYTSQNLLAAVTPENASATPVSAGSCDISGSYEYRYEGIYVREYGKNYRLFEYTDMLRGDEEPKILDMDGDSDDDILYLAGGKLYFKENRKVPEAAKSHVSGGPITLQSDDNMFFNGRVYHEAVNYFEEMNVSDAAINVSFLKPTDTTLQNFRMKYHTIVDRYIQEGEEDAIPKENETHIIDALVSRKYGTSENEGIAQISPHLASLVQVWAVLPGIKLTTEKLGNIKDQLAQNSQVTLTSKTKVYAANSAFTLKYLPTGSREEEEIVVPALHTLTLSKPVRVTSLQGDAYVTLWIREDIEGQDILGYLGKPLLPGALITRVGNTNQLTQSSHMTIRYDDASEVDLDMREIKSYTLYDLGNNNSENYTIRLPLPNDFYYAQIRAFKNDILGTLSQQILLAPQRYSDTLPPQIGLNQKIRIPVYQSQLVDLTPYIYEDGGFAGIESVRVDFSLDQDADGDGNTRNDTDTQNIEVQKSASRIAIKFGPYDRIFEKNILIAVEDDNGNIGSKEVAFEVYPPDPQIDAIVGNTIQWQIDESLLDEPVRLYRYRGGVIEKLQELSGADVVDTDETGIYSFQTPQSASGLTVTYSGSTIAQIDEYTGKITLGTDPTLRTKVIPSNAVTNDSIYPQIQILSGNIPVFRQFVKIPEGEIQRVSDFDTMDDTGIYMQLLDQSSYASYRVPLWVPINPGSVSVYRSDDAQKQAVMTIFADGRVDINQTLYELRYESYGEKASLVLYQKWSGVRVAQLVYHMQASYIIR